MKTLGNFEAYVDLKNKGVKSGDRCAIKGGDNLNSGHSCAIGGWNNLTGGDYCVISGQNNLKAGKYSVVRGYRKIQIGENSVALRLDSNTGEPTEVIINAPKDSIPVIWGDRSSDMLDDNKLLKEIDKLKKENIALKQLLN